MLSCRHVVIISWMTHNVCCANWVQVGGVFCVLQVGQSCAEVVINSLSAVVVPLHIQQMGDHVNSCQTEDMSLLVKSASCIKTKKIVLVVC